MRMYAQDSPSRLTKGTESIETKDAKTHVIQIEVQNHPYDFIKPKVSFQQGAGLVLIAGG